MITAQNVSDWMNLKTPSEGELAALDLIVTGVNFYVESLPSIDRDSEGAWEPTTRLGAIMLAARVFHRRKSPSGVEAVGEFTSYISRYDSDIARLLHIDTFRKPMVG